MRVELAPGRKPEGDGEQRDETEAKPDHEAERPEQHRHIGNGAARRPARSRPRVALCDVGPDALQQQRIAQIADMRVEAAAQRRIVADRLAARSSACIGDRPSLDAVCGERRPAR